MDKSNRNPSGAMDWLSAVSNPAEPRDEPPGAPLPEAPPEERTRPWHILVGACAALALAACAATTLWIAVWAVRMLL